MNVQPTVTCYTNQFEKHLSEFFFVLVSSVGKKDENQVRRNCISMQTLFSYLLKLKMIAKGNLKGKTAVESGGRKERRESGS